MENEKRNPPIHKFRLGQIEAAIWLNRGQNPRTQREETYHSVTVMRGYTDQQGYYRNTASFNLQHIPLVLKVLEHAYDYLHKLQQQEGSVEEPIDPESCEPATSGIPHDPNVFSR